MTTENCSYRRLNRLSKLIKISCCSLLRYYIYTLNFIFFHFIIAKDRVLKTCFISQNPPGLYGGRKVLSRAFRNRFAELHFDEIPASELETILHQRCAMPVSYCKQIISVMTDLQTRRKNTAAFAGKQGFITLRDLFRWGERYRLAPDVGEKLYDWQQHLADEGYLVLAAKVRRSEEADEIR